MESLVVNARFLSQPITGVQRFAIGVSRALHQSDREVKFLCPAKIVHPEIASELGAEAIGSMEGVAWEQIELPAYLKKNGRPHLLNLANIAPLSYTNQSIVLHDLAFLRHPEWFSRAFSIWYRFAIPVLIRKSKNVFTVSNFSRDEILSFWPEKSTKVKVIGNGLPELPPPPALSDFVKKKPYVIAYDGNNPRKNASLVLEAMKLIGEGDLRLILIGGGGRQFKNAALSNDSDRVERVSVTSDEALADLYSNAEALVYPSLYEGFGLPPLEALKYNCPSILSPIAAHKENFKQSSLMLKEMTAEELSAAILRIMSEDGLKAQLLKDKDELFEKHTFKKVSEGILESIK